MRLPTVLAATLAGAGCGAFDEPSCTVTTDVVGIAVPDSMIRTESANATLRVGETAQVCMLGSNDCMYSDERFEFRSDLPDVVAAVADAGPLSACNDLLLGHSYPPTTVSVGHLTAVGVGIAHVTAVLSMAGRVEKTAGLFWCPPLGPSAGCRSIEALEVVP